MPQPVGTPKGGPGPVQPRGLEVQELGRLIREKREKEHLSVRQAAALAGVSFSTLGRVESGNQPDLATFLQLCAWLGYPPDHFYSEIARRTDISAVDQVIKHLSTDPRLSKEAATRIAGVVGDMYAALARDVESPESLAMHLRAASIMRPGVPARLGGILSDMRAALEDRLKTPSS